MKPAATSSASIAVGRGAHLVALVAQRAAQDVGDVRVVLDDQNAPASGIAFVGHPPILARRLPCEPVGF